MPMSGMGIHGPAGGDYLSYAGGGTHYLQHWVSHRLPSIRTMYVNEGAGAVELTLDQEYVFEDALEEWQNLANAAPALALTYSFSFSTTAHTVTLAATGVFTVTFGSSPGTNPGDDLRLLLGFVAWQRAGSVSYTSDITPLGFCYPYGVEIGPPRELTDAEVRQYRHGRALSYVTHRGVVRDVTVRLHREHLEDLQGGPLFVGAVRVCGGDGSSAYQFDLYPLGQPTVASLGDLDYFAEVRFTGLVVTDPAQPSGLAAGESSDTYRWGEIASGFPFGYGVAYYVTIEGIPYIFAENSLEEASPAGFTLLDGALVIDDSAAIGSVIERHGDGAGIGRGFDFSFSLLDMADIRALMKRPTKRARLAADYEYSAGWPASLEVDDTTDWGAPSAAGAGYFGGRYVTWSGSDADTFTGVTVVTGAPVNVRADGHLCDVTDTPRYWRGRRVYLYAAAVTGFGTAVGGSLFSYSAPIWYGYLAQNPRRDRAGRWLFQARSIDRRLDDPVVPIVTGRASFDMDGDSPLLLLEDSTGLQWHIITDTPTDGTNNATITCTPFATGWDDGDTVLVSEAKAAIEAAWAAKWPPSSYPASHPTLSDTITWVRKSIVDADGASRIRWVGLVQVESNDDGTYLLVIPKNSPGPLAGFPSVQCQAYYDGGWTLHNGQKLTFELVSIDGGPGSARIVRITLDDGDPADVPSAGWVVLELGGQREVRRYSSVQTVDDHGIAGEVWLKLLGGEPGLLRVLADAGTGLVSAEVTARICWAASGAVPDLMRRLLNSPSATGGGGGYGADEVGYGFGAYGQVDNDSFDDTLAASYLGLAAQLAVDTDAAFTALFGGVLALSGHAVVPRRNGRAAGVQLSAVHCGLADGGYYRWTITDDELAAPPDGGSPIRPVEPRPAPNVVTAHLHHVTSQDEGSIAFRDDDSIRGLGPLEWEPHVYGVSRGQVLPTLSSWVASLFSQGATAQAIEVDVHPWIEAEPGDQVYLDLPRAYQLWQWSSGAPGFQGRARVIGEQVLLASSIRTLTVLCDGFSHIGALSPSAPITAFDGGGVAGVMTYIEVPARYYGIMLSFLPAGGTFELSVYLPSADTADTARVTVSDVAIVGVATRLTISAVTGAWTVAAGWYATLPTTTTGNDAQDAYAHNDLADEVWG